MTIKKLLCLGALCCLVSMVGCSDGENDNVTVLPTKKEVVLPESFSMYTAMPGGLKRWEWCHTLVGSRVLPIDKDSASGVSYIKVKYLGPTSGNPRPSFRNCRPESVYYLKTTEYKYSVDQQEYVTPPR